MIIFSPHFFLNFSQIHLLPLPSSPNYLAFKNCIWTSPQSLAYYGHEHGVIHWSRIYLRGTVTPFKNIFSSLKPSTVNSISVEGEDSRVLPSSCWIVDWFDLVLSRLLTVAFLGPRMFCLFTFKSNLSNSSLEKKRHLAFPETLCELVCSPCPHQRLLGTALLVTISLYMVSRCGFNFFFRMINDTEYCSWVLWPEAQSRLCCLSFSFPIFL